MKDLSRRDFVAATAFTVAGGGTFALVGCGKLAPQGAEKTKVKVYASDDELYRDFADYCQSMVFELPNTETKIPLFKATFAKQEAEFLRRLPFLPKSAEELSARYDMPIDALLEKMRPMEKKGFIYSEFNEDGEKLYRFREVIFFWYRMPGWPGRKDEYNKKISPLLNKYYSEAMVTSFNGYPTKGLRAIPAKGTIRDTRTVIPYEDVADFVERQDYWTVSHCACRLRHNLDPAYEPSDKPLEVCMHFGDLGRYIIRNDMGREISKEETLDLLTVCEEAGLVHGSSNTQTGVDTICNCGPYCLFLEKTKAMPLAGGHQQSNYVCAQGDKCVACGTCEERCPMGVLTLDDDDNLEFNPDRCLGCGVCAYKCPAGNLTLVRRPEGAPISIPKDYNEIFARFAKERGLSPVKMLWENADSLGEFLKGLMG